MKTFYISLAAVLLLFAQPAMAQTDQASLQKTILQLDSLVFEKAFNNCNFENFANLIHEDFEFYHDQNGFTEGKDNFISSLKNNICTLPYRPSRKLVKESVAIFPLSNRGVLYGIIQEGEHKFYANEEGRAEYFTSIAKFTHLWILVEGKWQLKRVLSYDHQSKEPDKD